MRISILLFGLCVAGSLTAVLAGGDDPWTGTWKLNLAKSEYHGMSQPKNVTITAVDEGDHRVLTFTGTGVDGSDISMKVVEPLVSGPADIEGANTGKGQMWDRADEKVIDSHHHEIVSMKGAKEAGKRSITLSPDGRRVITRFTGKTPDGKTISSTEYYEKQ